ncbi:MAG: hypothetical protein IPG01_09630 [Chitinophagaceae bacterium]|nr:hypothetical protein [Chitinophagaceae bacterium]
MNEFYKIKALVKFLSKTEGGFRNAPLLAGYRPNFDFGGESFKDGIFSFDRNKMIYPGDEFESDILFHDNRFFGKNFGKGSHFTFMEGRNKVGEGKVLEVIGLVSFHKE